MGLFELTGAALSRARVFFEAPIRDENHTWVLSKLWGRQTVPTLDKLVDLAPGEGFGYRAV